MILGILMIAFSMPTIVKGADDDLSGAVIIGALVVIYGAWFILRLAKVGVHASEEGITVVNPIRTHVVTWRKVRRFSCGHYGLWPKVGAELTDGTVLPIFGLLMGGQGPDSATKAIISKLNGHLGQARDRLGDETQV